MKGRCATCIHWNGDREKAAVMYAENPISMDLDHGWADDDDCSISYQWLTIEITGDASVTCTFNAAFGCIKWSESR